MSSILSPEYLYTITISYCANGNSRKNYTTSCQTLHNSMFSQPYGSVYNAIIEVTHPPLSSKLDFVKRRELYREPTTPKPAGLAARWLCPDSLAGVSAGMIIGQGILYRWTTLKVDCIALFSYSIHKYTELDRRHIYEREYVLFGINYPILLTNLKKKKRRLKVSLFTSS